MANYRYQVRTGGNQIQVGVVNADSVGSAANVLRAQGLHVLSLTPIAAAADALPILAKFREFNAGRPKQKHVLDFTQQLSVMIKAGINLRAALEGIAEQTQHPTFKKIIIGLKTDVESGKQFSEAIA